MAARKPPPLTPGTYWDDVLQRYVEPTEDAWKAETFAGLVGGAADEAAAWRDSVYPPVAQGPQGPPRTE